MKQTSLEEVRRIAHTGEYRLIPVIREIFADVATPVMVLKRLKTVGEIFVSGI